MTNLGGNCGHSPDPSIWYSQGCWGQIKMFILEQLHILATVVITLVFLQVGCDTNYSDTHLKSFKVN